MSTLRPASRLPASRHLQRTVVTPVAYEEDSEIRAESALMGEMKRAIARDEDDRRRQQERFASTVTIGACIIAAVRLARDADISRPSPRLTSVIVDSVQLARSILNAVMH